MLFNFLYRFSYNFHDFRLRFDVAWKQPVNVSRHAYSWELGRRLDCSGSSPKCSCLWRYSWSGEEYWSWWNKWDNTFFPFSLMVICLRWWKNRQIYMLNKNWQNRQWRTLTIAQMKKFLAVILHMIVSKSTDSVISPNVLWRDTVLIFVNVPSFMKLRPLLNTLVNKLKDTYYPEEAITIDEGMWLKNKTSTQWNCIFSQNPLLEWNSKSNCLET